MGPLDETWRVSTRTGTQGQCVEARVAGRRVEIRDSKDRSGPVLTFTPGSWTSFVAFLDTGQRTAD
ncbi:DUF397 domain-containing protein [Solwaraspora sp. WMMD1047]|uniref:DUF397 domain-containing protein n=1 Tax=Solwaraspora sp. WMMD1047 TaxID=3016102 RepID=UPI002417FDCC|nr:DUF397 domain-containing protein [Solwaraspora sp. WMMD1047]MDG4828667.1 DUF397 domain-containing protein [Solwaraspora sp. WMMD1047]